MICDYTLASYGTSFDALDHSRYNQTIFENWIGYLTLLR